MSTYLLIDIGAGTMDVLFYDDAADLHFKAVARSPVPYLAERIAGTKGDLIITGSEMGGGAFVRVLKQRAAESRVIISKSAAATLNHDIAKVRSWGIEVVTDSEAEDRRNRPGASHFEFSDIDRLRLEKIVQGLGVAFEFDVVGVCAQDHGVPPAGVSHLDFRHRLFAEALKAVPYPETLLYDQDAVPPELNRLKAISEGAQKISADKIFVMDSGMAAIQGASLDSAARGREVVAVLDIASSHTVGATLSAGRMAGFFEYHTSEITGERLYGLVRDLSDGRLDHDQILSEGGHGAFLRRSVGFEKLEAIIATGPKRRIVIDSRLPITFGAPMGDNMMTGTLGLLSAIRSRQGLPPVNFF
jgi:uncharacterized protein (DUF1786 family)